ncbi:ATP-dependent sacrificial sulfur transferase LarE [Plantactinospora sp. WMMB334]|uniref:ATP-dependent sacrificial sulfur transferase LarE n=1 Tax=Plantactinospora sp. WMMB334 TaxID=3404119 RepID=UPI003B944652
MTTPDPVTAGLDRLRDRLRAERRLLVAYSGGADSGLLAAVAAELLGDRAVAVTAVSPSLAGAERVAAREFCRRYGIAHLELATDELDRPEYVRNGGDRCFHCKSALFDAVTPLAALTGATVALGTNLDDLGEHRPGQVAAARRGVATPLVDAGLTKRLVREVSRRLGLVSADKPAMPCLASRIAYGEPVTPELLGRVEAAEDALRRLGFPVCRVRSHAGGTVARVELPVARLPDAVASAPRIDAVVRAAGFDFCALDLGGFASGRLNVLLPGRR